MGLAGPPPCFYTRMERLPRGTGLDARVGMRSGLGEGRYDHLGIRQIGGRIDDAVSMPPRDAGQITPR